LSVKKICKVTKLKGILQDLALSFELVENL